MRRIVVWGMSTLTVLVLLFSYSTSRSSTAVVTADSSDSNSSGSSSSGSSSSTVAKTYSGDAVMTRFGNVQVQITVQGGKITASDVLQVPWNDRHDQMINSRAVPVYNAAAVNAQSAQIDVMSGATVTWEGYTQSLQSAIDRAHL